MARRIPLFLLALWAVGLASGVAFEVVNPIRAGSRELLQVKTSCSLDFASMNYTPITSVCQPPYPPGPCCNAFISFVCPFVAIFNDNTTDCPENFFSYLNTAGSYPPGLFANECVQGPEGLACPAPAPAPSSSLPGFHLSTLSWVLSSFLAGFLG